MWQAPRIALLFCLLAAPAAANQRLPEWTYDDVAQTLTFIDSSGSPVVLGTVAIGTHTISVLGSGLATVANGGTGVTSFTANLPLIGNGAAAISQGSRSGNTTIFATAFGTLTPNDCVKIDASGNFVDAGGTCTTGGAGGVVNGGTVNQLAWYASTGSAVSGLGTAASSVLTTGAGSIPTWASTLPCVNVAAISGDVTGSSGSCSGRTVTGIQGVAVGAPTGTASSPVVLGTAPTINQPVIMGDTTSASNAPTGQIGEILSASATSGGLTSFTPTTVTSKSITAGHWACIAWGLTIPSATAVTNAVEFSASLTNNTNGAPPATFTIAPAQIANVSVSGSAGPIIYNFTTPTTVFMVTNVGFSPGTMTVQGTIQCQRIW